MVSVFTENELGQLGSTRWAPTRLGISRDKFSLKLERLEIKGFSKIDWITILYVKADIENWINRRRQVADNIFSLAPPKPQGR
jgi:hypothetical protein